jgi:hypothetical protein
VKLRPATADDAPKIAEIWHQGSRDGHLGSCPMLRPVIYRAFNGGQLLCGGGVV